MDWVRDMAARWKRVLSATGEDRTPLDEAVRQISEIGAAPTQRGRGGRAQRKAAAAAEASVVTTLSRQLIAGVVINDLMLDRLCALEGQTREQVLDQIYGDLPRTLPEQELRILQAELSGSCLALRPERPSYAGLGARVEQLITLAQEQASAIANAARAEAASRVFVPIPHLPAWSILLLNEEPVYLRPP